MVKMAFKSSIVSLLILIHIVFVFSGSCNPPKVEPPNQWVQIDNCTLGHTFKVTSPSIYKCSCWNHCGYRCRKIPSGHKPNHSEAPTTVQTTPTPKATKATKTPKVTKATTKATTTTEQTCPFGSPWIPPNQVNKRCICKKIGHKPYYDCNDSSSTSPATATTESDTDTTTVSSSTDTTTVSDTTTADTTTADTTTADTTTVSTVETATTDTTIAATTTTAGTTTTAAITTTATTAATTAAGRK